MKSRSTSAIVAALAAVISASPAQAAGLKQVAEISIPGDPITDIGIMAIDQSSGLGYLADKTNKSVVVFDTKTDKFVSRIAGFVGLLKDGKMLLLGPPGDLLSSTDPEARAFAACLHAPEGQRS